MKRLSFSIILILLIIAASDMSQAGVTGQCSNCHTMHNSQGGAPMAFQLNTGHTGYASVESPNPQLLLTDCVGCHTSTSSNTIITTGGSRIPIVYNTSSYPNSPLAGGNFYHVAQGGAANDARGHNVLGISSQDADITKAEGASGGFGCSGVNCHATLAEELSGQDASLRGGCQGCHLNVMHHANDGTATGTKKLVNTAEQGWYRFLAGHTAGPVQNKGVKGIEHSDWGYNADTCNHNEYLGVPEAGSTSLTNGSMTAFCCGCHEAFHSSSTGSGSPWLRHPSDFVIPNSGEYTNAFGAAGGGIGIYDPYSPVARPSLSLSANQAIVTLGTDMVMCLSCHQAHGSPYYKIMRWDYKNWPDSGSPYYGCGKCHTSKN